MPRVAIRVDASRRIGSGHIVRCLALAAALKRHGTTGVFVSAELPKKISAAITDAGYRIIVPDAEADDAAATIDALKSFRPDWVVVDHYGIGAPWHRRVKAALGCRIFAIDDLADRPLDCEGLLNQNIRRAPERLYQGLIPANCRPFLGPAYALLRPEFFGRPSTRRAGPVRRLLIFFGGGGDGGATLKTLAALGRLPARFDRVDVVTGGVNPQRLAIRACSAAKGFALHVDTPRMAELIRMADAAIGGGGVNLLERCRLGLPTLTMTVAANQEAAAKDAAALGLTVLLGRAGEISVPAIGAAIDAFVRDRPRRAAITRATAAIFGPSRLDDIVSFLA